MSFPTDAPSRIKFLEDFSQNKEKIIRDSLPDFKPETPLIFLADHLEELGRYNDARWARNKWRK